MTRTVVPLNPEPSATDVEPEDPIAWLRECLIAAFPIPGASTPLSATLQTACARLAQVQAPRAVPQKLVPVPARAPQTASERRADQRSKLTVFRSAILHWDGIQGLCLIRNLSPGGMMAKVGTAIPVETRVVVEMRSGHMLAGRVAWTHEGRIGVQFDARIDVGEVLNGPHKVASHWVQRMPRVTLPCDASLVVGSTREAVQLLDVSQGGAKVEAQRLRPGDDVTIGVGGMAPRTGAVVWTRNGRAGIAFHAAIPFDTLAQWALERQTAMCVPA
ncbi:PilZ domain-containing protein [Sphingomonas hengshuiensis]|uniref:PilZ domain-containing protein n=1 Tax=Sphingomonas hengshuiensis TaxID=1609977 RepID=UPI000A6F8F08|nr:PilZ domain-containing protein [Sphingomonas hengshuiensis]